MKKKIVLKVLVLTFLIMITVLLSTKFLKSLNDHVTVYVASENIGSRVLITDDMVTKVDIGFDEKVKFFNKAYESKESIVGKVAINSIKKGDVFSDEGMLLSEEDSQNSLDSSGNVDSSYFLSEDSRIGFISIEKSRALGGQIKKGDYLDIVFTSTTDNTGGLYASLLLQKVLVHKVEENQQSSGIVDIHLELQPEEALILSLAKYNGQLDILLTYESSKKSDVLPVIPPVLYEKLIEAGYLLIDDSQQNANNHQQSKGNTSDISELEKQIQSAEADLERAFAAMSAAKAALEVERNKAAEESVEDMIKRLEKAIEDLDGAVTQNKIILQDLEIELNNKKEGSE